MSLQKIQIKLMQNEIEKKWLLEVPYNNNYQNIQMRPPAHQRFEWRYRPGIENLQHLQLINWLIGLVVVPHSTQPQKEMQ